MDPVELVYVGRLRHKGRIHDGLHPAIEDIETWDRVQHQFKSQTQTNRTSCPDDQSFLAGKLYDDRGNRMGASHATKGGRRWRNYVSRGAVGTQAGLRIGGPRPASEIEIRVANAVGARSARATTARQGCSHETDAQAPQETRLRARSAVSDRLRSYAAAMSEMGLSARYEQGLRRNWLRIRIARRDGSARCSGSIARINLEVSVTRAAAYNPFKSNAISRQLNHTVSYASWR
jgi:hypothetical protein